MGANEGASAMTRDQGGVYLDGLPKDQAVHAYVEAMKAGQWVFTGPPIEPDRARHELLFWPPPTQWRWHPVHGWFQSPRRPVPPKEA